MADKTGLTIRHSKRCRTTEKKGARCNCSPSYEAWVWDKATGKKIPRRFPTAAAALGWRRDALSAQSHGRLRGPVATTLDDDAEAWILSAEAGTAYARGGRLFKPSVARTYSGDLRRHILPALGTLRVSEIRRAHVQKFVNDLAADGLSGSRIRGILNALRAVLRRARRDDELDVDPTRDIDMPPIGAPRERAASPAEAASLLAALSADRALWATAFYAGLRRGELRGLRWSDIDAPVTWITVRRGWDDVAGEVAPKSAKGSRRVPVASALRIILLEHKARTGRRDDDLVFGRTASAPFTPTHVRATALKAWAAENVKREERKLAPLDPIGLHECRHTFVSLMHAAGRSLEEIADYAGHSQASMTATYRHLIEGQGEEAAAALDAYLAAATS